MKKIYLIFPILFLFISCENKDLVIQKSKKNCSCIEKLKEGIYTSEFCKSMLINCDINPFTEYSGDSTYLYKTKNGDNNYKIFSKTNSMELVNKSKTKVYKVLVQIDNNGNINYIEYALEPTESVLLGCDTNFTVDFSQYQNISNNGDCYDALKLNNYSKKKIEYNIHKVELISEY